MKIVQIFFCIALSLSLGSLISGCVQEEKDKKEIVIWGSSATVLENELELDQDQWFFVELLHEYEKIHPEIEFKYQYFEDEAAMQQNVKTAAIAGTEPDIVNLWTGPYLSDLQEILLPLNNYIPEDDLDNIRYWEFLTDNMMDPSEGGNILGYPFGGGEIGLILYNKGIVESLGLDFENNPPNSVEKFVNALESFKKSGYMPMACSDYGTNYIVNLVFNKWWIQVEGLDHIRALSAGQEKFSDDESFIRLYSIMSQIYEDGYITPDYATNEDAYLDFLNGQAVLYPTGNWDINLAREYLGDDLGILELPDISDNVMLPMCLTGGSGQSLCVLKSTLYRQECVDFLSWLSNKENTIRICERKSVLPLRYDVDISDTKLNDDVLYKDVIEMMERTVPWHEYYMSPELSEVYYRFGTATITGHTDVYDFAQIMDREVARINKLNRN